MIAIVNSWTLVPVLLLLLLTPGSHSTKLHLDEVIGDVVEKLFGAVVQDEFEDLIDNCPNASAALKRTGNCISGHPSILSSLSHSSPEDFYVEHLCVDLKTAGKCLDSVIESLKSCACRDDKVNQRRNIEAVGASLDASLEYFCKNRGSNLKKFYKQGFPQCFIRRPARQLARCFPGRVTEQASDRHRNNNYWGIIGEEHNFFDERNRELLKNHTACAVKTLEDCSGSVDIFQSVINIAMNKVANDFTDIMCSGGDGKEGESKIAGVATTSVIHRLYLLMPIFTLTMSSIVGGSPVPSIPF